MLNYPTFSSKKANIKRKIPPTHNFEQLKYVFLIYCRIIQQHLQGFWLSGWEPQLLKTSQIYSGILPTLQGLMNL